MALPTDVAQTYRTRDLIEALIADPRQLGPDYQPIHSLANNSLVGFKATGRGAEGTDLADTLSLLDGARSLGLVERLDWAFRALAVEDLLPMPHYELHLTPEPETFGTLCPPRFAGVMSRGRAGLRVAAEIHPESFEPGVALHAGIAEIREAGQKVIVTGLVASPELVARAAEIRPDVVQIDLRHAVGAVSDEDHRVRQACDLAHEVGAAVMAIGVDTPTLREHALALGATLARGDLYGVPGPLPSS